MEYIFRKALRQDLNEAVSLFKDAIAYMIENNIFQWDDIYPNEKVLTGDIDNGEMYLLTKDNQIAACIVINEDQDEAYTTGSWQYTKGRAAVIHRLCVHPRAQGAGNGRRTMQFAEKLIQNMGYDAIRLDTFSQNFSARHLYETLGYAYVGEVTFRKGQFYLLEKAL